MHTCAFIRRLQTTLLLSGITWVIGCGKSEPELSAPSEVSTATANESSETQETSPDASVASGSAATVEPSTPASTLALELEKTALKFGFIKLTDCAPLVIAKEKGFFEDEGLQAEVVAQPN